MRLTISYHSREGTPLNYGAQSRWSPRWRHFVTAMGLLVPTLAAIPQVEAQQANQPGFDPRQTEKYFDTQSDQNSRGRTPVRLPSLGRPDVGADTRPQF